VLCNDLAYFRCFSIDIILPSFTGTVAIESTVIGKQLVVKTPTSWRWKGSMLGSGLLGGGVVVAARMGKIVLALSKHCIAVCIAVCIAACFYPDDASIKSRVLWTWIRCYA
jgi:hypothetical protein